MPSSQKQSHCYRHRRAARFAGGCRYPPPPLHRPLVHGKRRKEETRQNFAYGRIIFTGRDIAIPPGIAGDRGKEGVPASINFFTLNRDHRLICGGIREQRDTRVSFHFLSFPSRSQAEIENCGNCVKCPKIFVLFAFPFNERTRNCRDCKNRHGSFVSVSIFSASSA